MIISKSWRKKITDDAKVSIMPKPSQLSPKASVIIGSVGLLLFGIVSIVFIRKEPYKLEDSLIEVTGVVTEAREEGGSRYGDLLVQIDTSEIQYRSPMAYPSEFKYGSKTADALRPGTKIVLQLEESAHNTPPRKHRTKGYEWREFVGLRSGDTVHLAPVNHEKYEQRNDKLGKYSMPLLSLLGAVLVLDGIRKISAKRKTTSNRA